MTSLFDEIIVDNFAGGGGAVCPPMAEVVVRANYHAATVKIKSMAELAELVAV